MIEAGARSEKYGASFLNGNAMLHAPRIDERRFDALRFDGPGTELTVGLLPSSRFAGDVPGMRTTRGIGHVPNIPTEEIATTTAVFPRRPGHA